MTSTKNQRTKQLAAIHAAKRDLGLDDDAYRLMLMNVAGVDSAAGLDAAGRQQVLDHLRKSGWSRRPRKRVAEHPGTPHTIDRDEMLQKIGAQLADMGLPWAYADAIAKQQTGIERLAWVRDRDDLAGVIAALHVEQEKRGLLESVDRLLSQSGQTRSDLEAQNKLRRNWTRHRPTLRALVVKLSEAQTTMPGDM